MPDFSACDPSAVVSLDTIPPRQPHPAFPMLRPAALGDSLAAIDHGIVVDDGGRLHCFWTRGHDWVGGDNLDFGHASSVDLVEWTLHPRIRPGSADPRLERVWAPQIVRELDRWSMYFTGVQLAVRPADNVQRIYVVSSDDLFDWSPAELVLEPRHERIAWGSDSDWANDARDPMVYVYAGHMEMLLTIRLVTGDQSLARARRENGVWHVLDVLESVHGRALESAFVYPRGGGVCLLVNDWLGGGQAAWTADRFGAEWSRQTTDIPGFALELVELDSGYLLASRVWGSSILFSRFDVEDFSATNMVFPACYTGDAPLLRPGDNLVRIPGATR